MVYCSKSTQKGPKEQEQQKRNNTQNQPKLINTQITHLLNEYTAHTETIYTYYYMHFNNIKSCLKSPKKEQPKQTTPNNKTKQKKYTNKPN